MSDLFGNHIVGFPTRRLIFLQHQIMASGLWLHVFDSHWEDLDQLKLSPEILTSKLYCDFNVGG